MKFCAILIVIQLVSIMHHHINCVEVHFEAADSGFFLKHSRQPPVTPEISNIQTSPVPLTSNSNNNNKASSRSSYDSVLSLDRFTVVETTQPVSIRASYGPFSTKQTVPARYIVPDTMETQVDYLNNTTAALLELQQPNMHLDISAHLVRPNVPQDSPVLRVLFHAGADPGGHLQRQKVCVLLHVSMGAEQPLKGRCMPEGEDGVCVAEVIVPSNWWPTLPPPVRDSASIRPPQKVPQRFAQVSYSVFEPPIRNPEQCEPKVQIQPLTTFAQVPLTPATTPFREIRADDTLTFLLPQHPLFPMSKLHVPVFLHQFADQHVAAFTVRARVKSGIKILGATSSSDLWNISIEKENPKHTTARVTAFRKEQQQQHQQESSMETSRSINSGSGEAQQLGGVGSPAAGGIKNNNNNNNNNGNGGNNNNDDDDNDDEIFEVFSWLLEVAEDTSEIIDGGKIVWSVTYVYDSPKDKDTSSELLTTDEGKKRLIAKLEINKDDIQAVLPMAKIWELMNTAVLTGRQVAQAMKVFIVSQAGKVADVTLQSSCHAEDESVIKVSSSCSSVYVDGSEIRGSSNASVIVKYGTYVGVAKFIVWMPEFPLEVYISDFRLSQIKGWKVLDDNHYLHKQSRRRKKRSYVWGQQQHSGIGGNGGGGSSTNYYNNVGADKTICRARYQQSPVEVYAKFLAIDQNSGRISYFISRRTGLRVTDLVQPLLRVADPKIASLKGRILQGKSMGRTDVQVLSPITGRVIGAKEIRVGSDKVNLSKLIVRVISGLQLTITPDNTIENGYLAETSVTHKLTAQYQEGLLDIDLEFSDGSRTPLRDISVEDYFLLVESLDTEVVAFAPMLASHHPRVIAVGEGNGNLLRVTLLLSEDCRVRRNALSTTKQNKSNVAPLASALASIEVDFNNVDIVSKQESIQNDGIVGRDRKAFRNNGGGDLADIIVGIPLRDSSQHYEPTVQARQHRGSIQSLHGKSRYGKKPQGDMTSMEVGMYVLLTAICFAIVVFVISCVVYASKFRPLIMESGLDPLELAKNGGGGGNNGNGVTYRDNSRLKESTTNAHDWVWLGRSTIDRHSVATDAAGGANAGSAAAGAGVHTAGGQRDSRIRITSNPIINYDSGAGGGCGSRKVTSFDQQPRLQTHIVPPASLNRNELDQHYALHARNERKDKPLDYKPPVPPHRNIGTRTMITNMLPHGHGKNGNGNGNGNGNDNGDLRESENNVAISNDHHRYLSQQQQQQQLQHHKRGASYDFKNNGNGGNNNGNGNVNGAAMIMSNGAIDSPKVTQQQNQLPYNHPNYHHHNKHQQTQQQQQQLLLSPPLAPMHMQQQQRTMPEEHQTQQQQQQQRNAKAAAAVAAIVAAAPKPPPPVPPLKPMMMMMNRSISHNKEQQELHNAEKLVEYTNPHQKNAFQFDSLTPKRITKVNGAGTGAGATPASLLKDKYIKQQQQQLPANETDELICRRLLPNNVGAGANVAAGVIPSIKTRSPGKSAPAPTQPPPSPPLDVSPISSASTSSSSSPLISPTPPAPPPTSSTKTSAATAGEPTSKSSRVKRATVVGNPMFSATIDDSMPPGESLGLDDLDMDYEQIMHYFDNLKESNA